MHTRHLPHDDNAGSGHLHGRRFARGGPMMGHGREHGRGRGGRGGPGRGRGHRIRRGDVRIAILALLAESPMHGYQIIQELESRTGGIWQPSPGSVYPTLQQLSDEGLITSESQEGKNVFSPTPAGVEAADSHEGPAPWERFGDEETGGAQGLHRAGFQVLAALKQVGITGSPDQIDRARQVLADTRKSLYRILAEDES